MTNETGLNASNTLAVDGGTLPYTCNRCESPTKWNGLCTDCMLAEFEGDDHAVAAPDYTCASCNQFKDCESAFGAPGEVGLGCADWKPNTPEAS